MSNHSGTLYTKELKLRTLYHVNTSQFQHIITWNFFSGPYFSVFGLRKTPYLDTFHAVMLWFQKTWKMTIYRPSVRKMTGFRTLLICVLSHSKIISINQKLLSRAYLNWIFLLISRSWKVLCFKSNEASKVIYWKIGVLQFKKCFRFTYYGQKLSHHIRTLMVIIFLNFLMFDQIFLSPQMKKSIIISKKWYTVLFPINGHCWWKKKFSAN